MYIEILDELRQQHEWLQPKLEDCEAIERLSNTLRRAEAHYDFEDHWFFAWESYAPELIRKMLDQHHQCRELMRLIAEELETEDRRELDQFIRRFQAISQHNLIEEERDLFPILERALNS